jgi:hypothetical protein
MRYRNYNPNPSSKYCGDCVIRAFAAATDSDWDTAYLKLVLRGYVMHDMPSSNSVWGEQLIHEGFTRDIIPNTCPDCYTVKDFAKDHPTGTYVLGTGTHAVAVIDGDYYDAWDSGNEVPIYYYRKEK